VYDDAHVGHARTYVTLDLLRRAASSLSRRPVLLALNVTDVDDKVLRRARELREEPTALARRFEARFFEDLAALRCLPPAAAPRVTEHVADILEYVRVIEARGLAYAAADGSGLYLDTRALAARGFPYGLLAPRAVSDAAAAEAEAAAENTGAGRAAGKRSPRDFALWKLERPGAASAAADAAAGAAAGTAGAAGDGHSLAWDSPWGRGRPGWHIECSAMAHAVFGARLDLHAGGADLAFPHHCNELAQAQAFHAHSGGGDAGGDAGGGAGGGAGGSGGTGAGAGAGASSGVPPHVDYSDGWVGHWLHTGHVHIEGRKMSKSLKNFVTVRSMLAAYDAAPTAEAAPAADAFRMFCFAHHYASHLTFSEPASLRDAAAVLRRLRAPLNLAARALADRPACAAGGSSRWGAAELELSARAQRAASAATARLADDFDTPGALRHLGELSAALGAYLAARGSAGAVDARLISWAGGLLAGQLAQLGFECGEAHEAELRALLLPRKAASAAGAEPAAAPAGAPDEARGRSEGERAAVLAVAALRGAVRDEARALGKVAAAAEKRAVADAGAAADTAAAAAASAGRLLRLCDAVRDEAVPRLGWRLVDAPGGAKVEPQ
jgi:cysteinyl-tRNA synthetase